ncbi:uncharacterized protein DFL_003426 [Arthrobotrys flagrans]|uniref:Protein YOP1 n=1 Tax=Arthrobotrys flagrans TaxID=97331 RepID=A0A437A1T0_ARTFL|nr:hypothetical protein DFL_003426 [Arthrobotrys flagrans]
MAFQEWPQNGVTQFDKEQTNILKAYVIGGIVFLYSVLISNSESQLLIYLLGFVIPAYYSLQTLFTTQQADDTQSSLTYWVCFSFLTVLESSFDILYYSWFRLYYLFKFALILWLVLPQFNGAQILFRKALYPLFARYFQGQNCGSASIRAKVDAATEKAHTL